MTASDIIEKYISFFEKRGHKRIENASLIPKDDPTTLFTSSGMQALVPHLLGEPHPLGQRLVNVQNCFRAQDIDEVGDNRHITFFRMLGNWSLGDYFKKEEIPWFWKFLTKELGLPKEKLSVTMFSGYGSIPKDEESEKIWEEILTSEGLNPKERIFFYGAEKNWWSRQGTPEEMREGEPAGPDTEVFFDFQTPHVSTFGKDCQPNCGCGRFMEIGNSVFMQYQKQADGTFRELPQKNVDFGGGLERLLAAVEGKQDIFQTNLVTPMIKTIEEQSARDYKTNARSMRVITDHLIGACFIIAEGVRPSNKTHGYLLRRLIRRAIDHAQTLGRLDLSPVVETIVNQYRTTDSSLPAQFENIRYTIIEEENRYRRAMEQALTFVKRKYKPIGDSLKGITEISVEDAFTLYTTHGLSPTQIKSLGFTFNEKAFAEKMKEHQKVSRT